MLTGFFHEQVHVFFREKQESWYLATLSISRSQKGVVGTKEKVKNPDRQQKKK
jgi:hypothetical protein